MIQSNSTQLEHNFENELGKEYCFLDGMWPKKEIWSLVCNEGNLAGYFCRSINSQSTVKFKSLVVCPSVAAESRPLQNLFFLISDSYGFNAIESNL